MAHAIEGGFAHRLSGRPPETSGRCRRSMQKPASSKIRQQHARDHGLLLAARLAGRGGSLAVHGGWAAKGICPLASVFLGGVANHRALGRGLSPYIRKVGRGWLRQFSQILSLTLRPRIGSKEISRSALALARQRPWNRHSRVSTNLAARTSGLCNLQQPRLQLKSRATIAPIGCLLRGQAFDARRTNPWTASVQPSPH